MSVLRSDLLDWHGGPLVEVVGTGGERKLRLVSSMKAAEASSYQVALLYFSMTVLKFLEGTVLEEGVEGLWEKIYQNLSLTAADAAVRSRAQVLRRPLRAQGLR